MFLNTHFNLYFCLLRKENCNLNYILDAVKFFKKNTGCDDPDEDLANSCSEDAIPGCKATFEACQPSDQCEWVPPECDCLATYHHCMDTASEGCANYDCDLCTQADAPGYCFEGNGCCQGTDNGIHAYDCANFQEDGKAQHCMSECESVIGYIFAAWATMDNAPSTSVRFSMGSSNLLLYAWI